MSQTLYDQKSKNIRRTWLLMTVFFVMIMLLGWALSYIMNSPSILFFAVALSLVMNVGAYWFSDSIVMSISGARPLTPDTNRQHKQIYRLVENLCISIGLPTPKIYIIPDSAMNAFATGRDPKHGAIALTEGIIARLENEELEGVIAHELAHIANRDTLLQTIVVVLVGLVVLLSDWLMRFTFFGRRKDDNNSSGQLGLIILVVALILSIVAPLFAQLIQLAISRKREFLADASAALYTRYPEALASALQKISQDTEPLEAANRATAHLYISNPFKNGGIKTLFSTHPPVSERIKALTGMDISKS
jgi:heat shock protein HtpX